MGFSLGSLFGQQDEFDRITTNVDRVIDTLPDKISDTSNEVNATHAINEYIKSSENTDMDGINSYLQNINISNDRIIRYNTYDEIFRSVQLVKRIMKVYLPNILQKDLITNKLFIFKRIETNQRSDKYEFVKTHIVKLLNHYNIEDNLQNLIIPNMLRYGDFFIRLIDLENTKRNIPISKLSLKNNIKTTILTEDEICDTVLTKFDLIVEDDIETEIQDLEDDITINFNRVALQYIKPHNIIVLKSDNNQITLGYLYIHNTITSSPTGNFNPTLQMAKAMNQITGSLKNNNDSHINKVIEKITYKLISTILNNANIKTKLEDQGINNDKDADELIRSSLNDDVYYLIKELILSDKFNLEHTKINVDYIPVSQMVHFTIPSSEYYPYGESIIDSLVYPAKLYLINQLANTVMKLSRASVIRKWIVESGPRDINSSLLQQLKREFRNQRITADDILSFKTIPRILSDFKDLVVFSKKGQRFVDVEVNPIGDPNSKITDLEDARRELISLSGVPAAYLGQADIADLRDSLVNANISFANEIVFLQGIITTGINKLIDKVMKMYNESLIPSDYVNVSLTPPVVLMLQLLESTVSSVGNIFQTFQSIDGVDVDPYYLLERYLPYIDWAQFEESALNHRVKYNTRTPQE